MLQAFSLTPDIASAEELARKVDSELASVDDNAKERLASFEAMKSMAAVFKSTKVSTSKKGSALNRINKDLQSAEKERKLNEMKPTAKAYQKLQEMVQKRRLLTSRGSVILDTTLSTILSAREGGNDSGWVPEQRRVAAVLLPRWLEGFGYQPSPDMMELLFSLHPI